MGNICKKCIVFPMKNGIIYEMTCEKERFLLCLNPVYP